MRKKLFKIAYRLHLYKIAFKISPFYFWLEKITEFNKAVKERPEE